METKNVIITILIIIAVLGICYLSYTFLLKGMLEDYILTKQIEAKDIVLQVIINEIQTKGYADITDREGNILRLIPNV